MILPLAQLYSPSLDKYFHSDNALFIFENGKYREQTHVAWVKLHICTPSRVKRV